MKPLRDVKRSGIDTSDTAASVYSFVDNVGHASLTLDRASPTEYVSWWPDETHASFMTPTFSQDVEWEGGRHPSVTVSLGCLNESHIQSWWNRVRLDGRAIPYRDEYFPNDAKWTLNRTNCSHMVWLALKVGGAERYATLLRWGSDMVTPPQIHAYAVRLKAAAALAGAFR